MRVFELNMTDSSQQCPSGLRQRNDANIRTCVRDTVLAGCSSVMLSNSDVDYTSVCGRVIAYQFRSPNAFNNSGPLDSYYVDGGC